NVYVTGHLLGTVDFGGFELASSGSTDIFACKLVIGPPNATAITPFSTGPTNADTISFSVTFDTSVLGFDDESDLIISHNGTSSTGASIVGGPAFYDVTVTGISGDGFFTLEVSTISNVQNLEGASLDSSVTSIPVLIDN